MLNFLRRLVSTIYQISVGAHVRRLRRKLGFQMKKLNRYDTPADVQMRLNDSMVMYKGQPMLVATEDMQVYLFDPLRGNKKFGPLSPEDPGIDLRSPPLGYANTTRGAYYLTRSPTRQQKQGLDLRALSVYAAGDFRDGRKVGVSWVDLAKTIVGEYPTFNQAIVILKEQKGSLHSVAFHRRFCAIATPTPDIFALEHTGIPIGIVNSDLEVILTPACENSVLIEDLKSLGFSSVTVQEHTYE